MGASQSEKKETKNGGKELEPKPIEFQVTDEELFILNGEFQPISRQNDDMVSRSRF